MRALTIASIFVFLLTAVSVMAADFTMREVHAMNREADAKAAAQAEQDKYDRLDGRGKSGIKIDVVEWEGNLEVHVYPAGALKSLAAKLDLRDKEKPVMVLGIRFKHQPQEQLVRRAILGVPFREGFLAFRDPGAGSEYDKIILSNHGLSGLAKYELEPGPNQLYPDGHPSNSGGGERLPASSQKVSNRVPYMPPTRHKPVGWQEPSEHAPAAPAPRAVVSEDGAIRPFDFR